MWLIGSKVVHEIQFWDVEVAQVSTVCFNTTRGANHTFPHIIDGVREGKEGRAAVAVGNSSCAEEAEECANDTYSLLIHELITSGSTSKVM